MSNLVGIGEMARRIGVSVGTLRRWDRQGRLCSSSRTLGGHRGYDVQPDASKSITVLYARVSSHDQKPDLSRQVERLQAHAVASGWSDVETITDLGSGLNFRKKGLLRLLMLIMTGRIQRLVIENRDRLSRFGAELILALCRMRGIKVVVTEHQSNSGFEAVLVRDVLEIITVFFARLYGSRSAGRRKAMVA